MPNIEMGLIYILFCFIILKGFQGSSSLELVSYISQNGLHGTITFTKVSNSAIKISTKLEATLEYPNQVWSWSLTEFPTDYTYIENRCDHSKLGNSIVNLDEILGYLILPDNGTMEIVTQNLTLSGPMGLYGKSILLKNVDNEKLVCASITVVDKSIEKTATARFNSPVAGSVFFKWFSTQDNEQDMIIISDLYHVSKVKGVESNKIDFAEHSWKIYVTDILNHESESVESSCNILQLVFDQKNSGSGHAAGDIDHRLGKIKVSKDVRKSMKSLFRDGELILLPSDLTGPQRRLYLVIFDTKHEDSFLACAKIRYEHSVHSKIIIQSGGIKGDIKLSQYSHFEPTFLSFQLTTARGDLETRLVYSSSVASYKIHELPIKAGNTIDQMQNLCLTTKFVYNPLKMDVNSCPPNGFGTQDQYPIGELSGKLLGRNNFTTLIPGSQELSGEYWDVYLPLQGQHSVIHRSLVIYKNTQYPLTKVLTSEPWICGAIVLYQQNFKFHKPIYTAEVIFRYPVVARVLYRQPKDEPWADTTVLVEYVIHADGSQVNNSAQHRWAIHEQPPGKDFYNWTARCLSTGPIFNPYQVDFDNKSSINNCSMDLIGFCRLGDLSTRIETLDIAGSKKESDLISRKVFTDQLLPLTGPTSIVGKSLVLYDDHGPKARGERLGCSKIGAIYRRKAVAREWFPNGEKLTVQGKIEFFQETEYDITNVEVSLESLHENSGYHVHSVPVEENLEFPCEETSLYDQWNPLNVDPESSPKSYHGTPDQYEMGDLSGKFGALDNNTIYKQEYNDTMLPLFGPRSILGRSIVINKRKQNRRWGCSTIERGYSPSEAREIRAIASFHHPQGFAYGYLRMKQLIYNDGSASDTVIEIKLRHPGKNDRNITRNHNWAIYVNPVGVDASVQTQNTRCVAGGYIWNPYYTQLADPLNGELYRQECGPDNPLRCYVGDVSSRVGTIDIGLKRTVVVDSNFPLEGQQTAVGRSIVILSPNQQPERYACANIEPDYDIIKYANIEKPPRFVLAQFIEDVRRVMGIPEWMLSVDSRQTKILHNDACMQVLLHFKGPIASQLEKDFSRLISLGTLDAPSLYIPGYIDAKRKAKISYKQCGMRDPNERTTKRSWFLLGSCSQVHPTAVTIILAVILCSFSI